jgi:hypothetical protein
MKMQKSSLVLNGVDLDHGDMTTRLSSFRSLRALAASMRSGHLAGGSWSAMADRDLDRVAGDLLVVAHADPERLATGWTAVSDSLSEPVDLNRRRAGGLRAGSHRPATHARAS